MRRHSRRGDSLLRNDDFLKLWWGQAVSETGSAVTLLAVPLLAIITLKATAFEVGALEAVQMAPFLLIGLPAGAVVDWMRRRQVLLVSDVGRLIVLGSIPLASAFGLLTLAQVFVVAFLSGVLTVFFDVAYQSYLPQLVGREHLTDANSKLTATQQISSVGGPALGGVLVGAVGAATAIAADAVSYFVSVVSLVWIRTPEPKPQRARDVSLVRVLRRDTVEGLRYVARHRTLRMIAGCTGSSNLTTSLAFAVLTLFMVRRLHLHPAAIGLIFAVGSVAGLVGAIVANPLLRRFGVGPVTIAASLFACIGGVFFPLAQPGLGVIWIPAGMATFWIGGVIYNIGQVSYRQTITPDRLLGRMNATMRFMVWGTMPIGSLIGGALGATIGLRPTLWVGAIGGFLSPLFVLFSPLRSVHEMPPGAEAAPEIVPSPEGPVPVTPVG